MENDSTDYLNGIGLLFKNTPSSLSYSSKSLRENIIESLTSFESVLEFLSLSFKFCVGEFAVFLVETEDFILNWLNTL